MDFFDVIIVGAGPAGAATAQGLKDHGLQVLVLEKKELPRFKLCSGLILPSAKEYILDHFGEIPADCYCTPRIFQGVKIAPPDGPEISIPQLSIWRNRFDNWLLKCTGASVQDHSRLSAFHRKGDSLIVKAVHDGKERTFRTRCLVGADGANSRVRKYLFPNFDKEKFMFVAYEEQWHGSIDLSADYLYWFFDHNFSEGPYAAFAIKDDCLISVTAARLGSKVKEYHQNFMNYLITAHNFQPNKLMHAAGCFCNFSSHYGYFCLGKNNVILVGDAAGFMGAFGEGITAALITGGIAAEAILKSAASGDAVLSFYAEMVEKEKQRTLREIKNSKQLSGYPAPG